MFSELFSPSPRMRGSSWVPAFAGMTKLGVAAVAFAALGACTAVDHGFGESLKYDMALQTINPAPVYAPNALQPGYHGEKGQKAVEDYRKGKVNDKFEAGLPAQNGALSTTKSMGSGGGGGGSR